MIHTASLFDMCQELFAGYPLAVKAANRARTIQTMVLMMPDGDTPRFLVISTDNAKSEPTYTVHARGSRSSVEVTAAGTAHIPEDIVHALAHGSPLPLPRDGSLFGWSYGDAVTALIGIYTRYTPEYPEPRYAVMPLAGISEALWPPFTGERFFGPWFWEYYEAGSIVHLDEVIAKHPGTVFWVDVTALVGSDFCLVEHDIRAWECLALRRGCYVYYQALRGGRAVESITELLANAAKTDLAPQFAAQVSTSPETLTRSVIASHPDRLGRSTRMGS
jgi:hypothetical protein